MTITLKPPKNIFPIKILTSHDDKFSEYKDDMVEWMTDYSLKHDTFERSNSGGYQSPDKFYLEEDFAPYLNRISEQIQSMIDEYTDGSKLQNMKISLSNMWFNFNYQNCYNVMHSHPGSVLAGCLWVHTIEDHAPLVFVDPMAHNTSELNEDVIEVYYPNDGDMVLFPGYLPHRVDINKTEETRISISFNLYIP